MKNSTMLGAGFAPAYHRPFLRYFDGEQGGGAPGGDESKQETADKKFTQADVDRIVNDRLKQQERTKFGDYADLKAKAEGAQTVEQKLADLEKKHADAEARALRSDIAAEFGVNATDRDLFLTGTDRETLTAQAKRLQEREGDRKKQGNVAPKEGDAKNQGKDDNGRREFARALFGRSD